MRIFHLKHPRMKHEENSIRGVQEAARKHFGEIDIDVLMTKADPHCPVCTKAGVECEGHIVGCHWDEPMVHDGFKDPEKKLDRHTKVRDMTLPEVQRLRARTGLRTYHISLLAVLLAECAKRNVQPKIEPKDDKRFESVTLWRGVKTTCNHLGLHPTGYSLRNFATKNAGVRRTAAMTKAGIPAHPIH